MAEEEARYSLDRVVRMVLSAIVLAVVLVLLRYLSDVLLPFAAAVVLAYLLNPLVTLFEQKTGRRGAAVAITLCGLGVMGLAVVTLVMPLIAYQISGFGRDLERLRRDIVAAVQVALEPTADAPETLGAAGGEADATITPEPAAGDASGAETGPGSGELPASKPFGLQEFRTGWAEYRENPYNLGRQARLQRFREALSGTNLAELLDQAAAYVDSDEFRDLIVGAAKRVLVGGWTVVAFAVNLLLGLTGLIIVLLYLVFLLLDFPEYARTWQTFLPPRYRDPIVDFLEQFNTALRRYFRGQALVALSMAVIFVAGFAIIGLPMAVPLGLFIGLLNMVPYLQTVGLVPALLLALVRSIEGDSSVIVSVVLVLVVFAVAQIIQDALITPRVMGKATGLRPVAILLGVFIWGKLLGFLGLLLAIPLTCLGIAYYRRYVLHHAPETTKPVPEK